MSKVDNRAEANGRKSPSHVQPELDEPSLDDTLLDTVQFNEAMNAAMFVDEADDVQKLRHQMFKVNRRLTTLERHNKELERRSVVTNLVSLAALTFSLCVLVFRRWNFLNFSNFLTFSNFFKLTFDEPCNILYLGSFCIFRNRLRTFIQIQT